MTINQPHIGQISEQDLLSLVETGVPEGQAIEYKSDRYSAQPEGGREFLKDLTSFANTAGGHLIIGMSEDGGLPKAIAPLTGDHDKDLQRFESLARDGVTPRITGIRMTAVFVQGGFAILIRIPRSWNPPHRVTAQNSNRFFARNSAGAYEMSVDDLRNSFLLAGTARDRARDMRRSRLAQIAAGDTPVLLPNDHGQVILHIFPLSAFAGESAVDLSEARSLGLAFQPMGSSGTSPRYNFEGLVNVMGGDNCYGYTQLFRDGCIESVRVRAVIERPNGLFIPSLSLDQYLLKAVPSYLDALQHLGVTPPLAVMITLAGVKGAVLGVDERIMALEDFQPIRKDTLELPEVLIEDYGEARSYHRAVRPAFDALWNAGGHPASGHFDDAGNWTGVRPHRGY